MPKDITDGTLIKFGSIGIKKPFIIKISEFLFFPIKVYLSNMKLIINENKFKDVILRFINRYYDANEINVKEYRDKDGTTSNNFVFYTDDYYADGAVFRLYNNIPLSLKATLPDDKKPSDEENILIMVDDNMIPRLNDVFQDKWIPVFKEWFKENFGFEVNLII